ncbi:DNA-directed RNA polymerase [Candidatus Micrarchaeota archaeon]|nr:DNA-directed RNA polymerase [Candidatus Micrarchaeota archaeon]
MYYIKTVEDKVRIPPTMFGSEIKDAMERILRERYEGRIYKDMGIVLSVNNPKLLSEGVVIPGDGGAYYNIEFEALTFLPLVNEVFLGEIKELVEFGAFTSIGPFQGLLHVSQIGKDRFFYDKKSKTLGSKAAGKNIKKGDEVLLKVSTVSMKSTSSDTKIGLTMRPDGLGKLEWVDGPKKKKTESKAKEKSEPKEKEKTAPKEKEAKTEAKAESKAKSDKGETK